MLVKLTPGVSIVIGVVMRLQYQSVVAKHGEKDEVEGVDETVSRTALWLDTHVHHLIPILTRQNLE